MAAKQNKLEKVVTLLASMADDAEKASRTLPLAKKLEMRKTLATLMKTADAMRVLVFEWSDVQKALQAIEDAKAK